MLAAADWTGINTWERDWWGNCANTFNEERKQFVYAKHMGLRVQTIGPRRQFGIANGTKSVLDIGGGPVSLLLKCDRWARSKVVDPCTYPDWIYRRYDAAGIAYEIKMGEDIDETGFDEVWIYNCLQHVRDPVKIITNARRAAGTIRMFEWINTKPNEGHPHTLTKTMLDAALGQSGATALVNESGCVGACYYGAFTY